MRRDAMNGSLKRALVRSDAGQAIAELVVIAPLLLLLLAGLVELGRYANLSILVANAARAGVAYGAQSSTTAADATGMQNAALADGQNISGLSATASSFCQCADGTTSTCQPSDCSASHKILYVQVNSVGTLQSLINYPGLASSFRISTQAIMRVPQ